MYKWDLAPLPDCECGATEQVADHYLTTCLIYRQRVLTFLDGKTRCWFTITSALDLGTAIS